MKLVKSKFCRKRYRAQAKLKWWLKGSRWGWNTGEKKQTREPGKNEN